MAAVMRRHDWPERLAAFLEERRNVRFRWGENDCVLFAADAVQAMTGVDLAAPWRGQWDSRASATDALGRAGGLLAAVDMILPAYDSPTMAGRGDLAAFATRGRIGLAVCVGAQAIAPSALGWQARPMGDALAAWRV